MKLIVCGGREYGDYHALKRAIEQLKPTYIAHGAARGADTLADEIATHLRIPVRRYVADWKTFGRAAGMMRNGQMLKDFEPDAVLAAPGGNGTANMVIRSLRQPVPVYALNAARELVRLPELERDHNNKSRLPRDIDPQKFVSGLIQRGTPPIIAKSPINQRQQALDHEQDLEP